MCVSYVTYDHHAHLQTTPYQQTPPRPVDQVGMEDEDGANNSCDLLCVE